MDDMRNDDPAFYFNTVPTKIKQIPNAIVKATESFAYAAPRFAAANKGFKAFAKTMRIRQPMTLNHK